MERTAPEGRAPATVPPTAPDVRGRLRRQFIRLPVIIREVPRVRILNRHIRSVVFSTDVAVMRNTDADAVIAVYPLHAAAHHHARAHRGCRRAGVLWRGRWRDERHADTRRRARRGLPGGARRANGRFCGAETAVRLRLRLERGDPDALRGTWETPHCDVCPDRTFAAYREGG
jgi:hypothetical protein